MRNKNAPNKNQTTETDESNCKPQSLCKHLTFSTFIFTSLDFIFSTDAYFINLVNLLQFLREYKLVIDQETHKLAEKFGQTVLDKFLHQIQDKCNEAEQKIRKNDNHIFILHTAFYILIIILVTLSSFFVSIIVANAEILHSAMIWKTAICCILMAVFGIVMAVIVQKFLDKRK